MFDKLIQSLDTNFAISRMALFTPWGGLVQKLFGSQPVNAQNLSKIM
jgi:hypothetical protein